MSTDDLDPQAEDLRARMHAGTLPRARLELADELGHAPSRSALGRKAPEPAGPWDHERAAPTVQNWGRRVGRFGGAIMLRVGTALCRHLVHHVTTPEPTYAHLEFALVAADGFLGGNGSDVDPAAQEVARAALQLELDSPHRQLCLTLLPLLRAMLDVQRDGAPDQEQLKGHYLRMLEQALPLSGDLEALQAAVRDEVVAWALAEVG